MSGTTVPPKPAPTPAPLPELTQQEKTLTIAGVLLALLLAALDQTIVATAGPVIQRDLKIEQSLYIWITTAYLVASTVTVPLWGKLSDIFGRKPILLIAVTSFLAASALCGLSQNSFELIAFRALQGIGSGALFTTAFAVIADIFPPAVRGRYTGLFGAVFGLSSVIGPLVGGFLTDTLSWHWVFYVNLPIGAVALAFIALKMPLLRRGDGTARPRVDWIGAFWLIFGVVPLLIALSLGKTTVIPGEAGFLWGSWQILGMFALAVIGIVAFLITERRVSDPIIDLKLFSNRVYSTGTVATFVLGAAFLSAIVFLPLFMVNVVGLSATNSGLTTTPLTFAVVAGNIITGQLVTRLGRYKGLMVVGLSVLAVGFAIMAFTLTPSSTQGEVTLKMILLGLGLGPTIPLYTLAVQNAVQPWQIGQTTSSLTFFRQMGSTIGLALLGSVFANTLSNELPTKITAATASLPAAVQQQFSQGGAIGAGAEGTATLSFDASGVAASVKKSFAEQKTTLERAIRDDDPAAVQKVLANPQAPQQLKDALQNGGVKASVDQGFQQQYDAIARVINTGNPAAFQAFVQNPQLPAALRASLQRVPPQAVQDPRARAAVLATIKQNLDAAETQAEQQAVNAALENVTTALDTAETQVLNTLPKVSLAFKESLTDAIKAIYLIGIGIVIIGFIVSLLIPELPLRKTNSFAPAMAE